jgi:hypothetical protein
MESRGQSEAVLIVIALIILKHKNFPFSSFVFIFINNIYVMRSLFTLNDVQRVSMMLVNFVRGDAAFARGPPMGFRGGGAVGAQATGGRCKQ